MGSHWRLWGSGVVGSAYHVGVSGCGIDSRPKREGVKQDNGSGAFTTTQVRGNGDADQGGNTSGDEFGPTRFLNSGVSTLREREGLG